jgi:hypothetical protein
MRDGRHSAGPLDGLSPELEGIAKMTAGERKIIVAQRDLAQQVMSFQAVGTAFEQPQAFIASDVEFPLFEHKANFFQIFLAVPSAAREYQLPGLFRRELTHSNAAGGATAIGVGAFLTARGATFLGPEILLAGFSFGQCGCPRRWIATYAESRMSLIDRGSLVYSFTLRVKHSTMAAVTALRSGPNF